MQQETIMQEEQKYLLVMDNAYVSGFSFVKRTCKTTNRPQCAIKMSKPVIDKFIKYCKEADMKNKFELIPLTADTDFAKLQVFEK